MQRGSLFLRYVVSAQPGGVGRCGIKTSAEAMSVSAVEANNKHHMLRVAEIPEVSVGADKVKAIFSPPKLSAPLSSGVKVDAVPPIVELTREIRHRAWNAGFLDMINVRETAMTFIAGLRYDFTPTKAHPGVDNSITLTNVGNTSFATRLNMLLPAEGRDVDVENVMYWVHVDKSTRSSKPLPEWFKKKYLFAAKKSTADKLSPLRLPRYTKPTWVMRTITRDEIDKFGHTNYEHYLQYAIESMRENLVHPGNQPLDGRSVSHILDQSVENIDILFSGETRLGDQLQICSWLNADSPNVAHSMVYKNGRPIVHTTFKFKSQPKSKI